MSVVAFRHRTLEHSLADLPAELQGPLVERLAEKLMEQHLEDQKVVDVPGICARFGLKADWVRANYARLGGFRSSDGRRAEYWFRPFKVAAALDRMEAEEVAKASVATTRSPKRRSTAKKAPNKPGLTRNGNPLIQCGAA